MRRHRPLILLCLLSFVLAGCSQTHEPTHAHRAATIAQELQSRFEAHYSMKEGASLTLNMGNTTSVLGRDGITRLAVPLRLIVHGGQPLTETAWLARDGRVVRWDSTCSSDPQCLATASWRERGTLPPLGTFWPSFITGGNLLAERFDPSIQSQTHWNPVDQVLNFTSSLLPYDFDSPSGTFRYDDRPVPVEAELRGYAALHLTRTSFVILGGQTQAPDIWPDEPSWTKPAQGALLPGSTVVIPPWKHPIQDFLDQLHANPEAKAMWDNGCLTAISLYAPGNSTVSATGTPVGIYETAAVNLEDKNGSGFNWQVQNANGVIGPLDTPNDQWAIEKRGAIPQRDCNLGQRARVPWDEAYAKAKRFMPANQSSNFSYYLSDPNHFWDTKAAPAWYDLFYTPKGAGSGLTLPPHIILSSTDGLPEAFLMPTKDMDAALMQLASSS